MNCPVEGFVLTVDRFGYPTLGLSRGNLLRILYENLPEHETKVKANANVVRVETLDDGVRVHLADGTIEDGSIVIAADGVHSATRELIQGFSPTTSARGSLKPISPMVATYLSLFGHTRGDRSDVQFGDFAESHGHGTISQSIRLRDAMYFTVLKRLDEPVSEQKKRFTSEELDKFVQDMPDLHIFPGVKLQEIWPMREQTNAILLHQEEGIAEKWYHGRVVLVGDAAHKMTSVNGMGALSAIISATTLVNQLHAALQHRKDKNAIPSTEDLEAVFAQYEAERKDPARAVVNQGMMVTRFASWAGGETAEAMDKAMSRQTKIIQETRRWVTRVFRESPVLNFIPFEGKHGTTRWEVEVPVKARL